MAVPPQKPEHEHRDVEDRRDSMASDLESRERLGLKAKPKRSFTNLTTTTVATGNLDSTKVENPKDVAEIMIDSLKVDKSSLSPTMRTVVEVYELILDPTARMTRELRDDHLEPLRALRDTGTPLDAEQEELLKALEMLDRSAPFTEDDPRADAERGEPRGELDPTRKTAIETGAQVLKDKKKEYDDAVAAGTDPTTLPPALTPKEETTLQVYEKLLSPRGIMEEDLYEELVRLEGAKKKYDDAVTAGTTPLPTALTTEEAALLAALQELETIAPYGPTSRPKDPTAIAVDSAAEKEKIRDRLAELTIQRDLLSPWEQEFILLLDDKDFYGTGRSTMFFLEKGNFNPDNFTETKFARMIDQFAAQQRAEGKLEDKIPVLAAKLSEIATNIRMIQEEAKIKLQFEQELIGAAKEEMDQMPKQKLTRQVKRRLRRIRFGLEREFAKNPNKGLLALGAGVLMLGWGLTSDNPYVEKIRKAMYGGTGLILAGVAADFASGAILDKPLSKQFEEMSRLAGTRISENVDNLFRQHTIGGIDADMDTQLSYLSTTFGLLRHRSFGEVWDLYEKAKTSGSNKIRIPGINENNIFDKHSSSEAFFLGMQVFDNRYGDEIRHLLETEGHIPGAGLSMMNVITHLVALDRDSRIKAKPFEWIKNRFGAGLEWVWAKGGKLSDSMQHMLSAMVGTAHGMEKYFQSMFPEDKYGKIKVMWNEKVIVLPGGVRCAFDYNYRTLVQGRDPKEVVSGIILKNKHDEEHTKVFGLEANNKEDIENFAKQLIRDTAVHKMPKVLEGAGDVWDMKEFARTMPLDWNDSEKSWFVPGFEVGAKTYKIKTVDEDGNPTTETRTLEFPGSRKNVFLNLKEKGDEGTFMIRFYRNDKFWDKTAHPTESLAQMRANIEKENFKNWLLDAYHFPFSVNDIELEEKNWEDIREGRASSIEGYVKSTTRRIGFTGEFKDMDPIIEESSSSAVGDIIKSAPMMSAAGHTQLVFEFKVPGTTDVDKTQYWEAFLVELITTRFDNLKSLAGKGNEKWFKDLFSVQWPWEYFKDIFGGGSIDETEWANQLESRKQLLIEMVEGGDITPDKTAMLNDTLRSLAKVEEALEEKIGLEQEIDKDMFEQVLTDLETLEMPPEARAEYTAFKSRLEHFYNFEPEALQRTLRIFQKLLYTKDATGRTLKTILEDPSTTPEDKQHAVEFLQFYSEKMIMYFNQSKSGKGLGQISLIKDVGPLEIQINESLENDGSIKRDFTNGYQKNVWPTLAEYMSPVDGSLERKRFDVIRNMHEMHRLWMYHTNLVMQPLLTRLAWKPFGFDYHTRGDIDPQLIEFHPHNIISGGKVLGFPMIGDALEQTFQFEHYDIIWRVLDTLGLYPKGLAGGLKYPTIGSVNNFKRDAGNMMERRIQEYTTDEALTLFMNPATVTAGERATAITGLFPGDPEAQAKVSGAGYEDIMYLAFNKNMEDLWGSNRLSSNLIGEGLHEVVTKPVVGP
ncbi:hypothetical protein HOG48_01855 [Candidatus Peregrinibacteria bacterium]|jgi:hypothetical protein|nr:hypothetical protein [Candidatus Peregrinibacteria bacterium]